MLSVILLLSILSFFSFAKCEAIQMENEIGTYQMNNTDHYLTVENGTIYTVEATCTNQNNETCCDVFMTNNLTATEMDKYSNTLELNNKSFDEVTYFVFKINSTANASFECNIDVSNYTEAQPEPEPEPEPIDPNSPVNEQLNSTGFPTDMITTFDECYKENITCQECLGFPMSVIPGSNCVWVNNGKIVAKKNNETVIEKSGSFCYNGNYEFGKVEDYFFPNVKVNKDVSEEVDSINYEITIEQDVDDIYAFMCVAEQTMTIIKFASAGTVLFVAVLLFVIIVTLFICICVCCCCCCCKKENSEMELHNRRKKGIEKAEASDSSDNDRIDDADPYGWGDLSSSDDEN